MDIVDETMRAWRRTPHKYGENDCVLSAAEYFMKLGAADAMPPFAGTYGDNETAMMILAEYGGMERMMEFIGGTLIDGELRIGSDLHRLGPATPQRGDIIGLVADLDYVIPALCTGDGVAARLERGVIEVDLRFVQWRGVWRGVH